MLQAGLITERILNRILGVVWGVPSSDVKKLAVYNFLASLWAFFLRVLFFPFSMLAGMLRVMWSNALATVVLIVLICVLAVMAETSGGWLPAVVNTYNAGVGLTIQNEWIQPLVMFEAVLGYFVRVWNLVLWASLQVVLYVIVPSIRFKPENLLVISGNTGLFVSASVISASTTFSRTIECTSWRPPQTNITRGGNGTLNGTASASLPFLADGLQCVGNKNYLELDLMTPSIYLRNTLTAVTDVVAAGCTAGDLGIRLVMYPLLDYNLYKALHCLVNVFVQALLTLPIATYQRCQYGKQASNAFSVLEQQVMCIPDVTMTLSTFNAMTRALGRLVDNWGDFAIIVIEKATGIPTVVCSNPSATAAQSVRSLWREAGEVLGSTRAAVSLSDSLHAVTDGVSTVYTTTRTGQIIHAVGNWPFPIETRAGVASVRHSWELDADDGSSVHTGLLGCRCLDTVVDAVPQIQILCASVPYRSSTAFDEEQLNSSTVIETRFYPQQASFFMRCATTRLRVSPLRFSRKRVSRVAAGGVDVNFQDTLDALGGGGRATYAADAAIYVQPECSFSTTSSAPGSANGLSQCVGERTCFPFCMGLHLAGQNSQAIMLYNAREWEQSVQVAQMDCVGAADLSEDDSACETVRSTSEALDFSDTNCVPVCVPNDNTHSSIDVSFLQANSSDLNSPNSSTLSLQKEGWGTVRLGVQPFVVAGDVMLFHDEPSESVVVTRLYDNNRGDYSVQNEQLTLASNRHAVPVWRCETEDARVDGVPCQVQSILNGAVVIPSPNQLRYEGDASSTHQASGASTYPATVSQWAVHWIYNPDDTVVQATFQQCRTDPRQYAIVNFGAYARPRIWTLKTMRLSSMGGPAQPPENLVSYMVVPDWFGPETSSCEQEVNLRVLGLEYVDSSNVLISVLRTTPSNYDWKTGTAHDETLARVVLYYMHPNVHTCSEIDESNELIFTCWRDESEGMFPRDDASVSRVALGTICPEARRFPSLGIMAAETVVAAVETLRLALDGVLVIPAALHTEGHLGGVYAPRVNKPTFHSALDNSGTALMNPDAVLEALEKVSMYGVQFLVKLADILRKDEDVYIATVVLGTARVIQHSGGVTELKGSLLGYWNSLKKAPTSKVVEGVQANVPGFRRTYAMKYITDTVSGLVSSLRLNVKLMQRILLKVMRALPVIARGTQRVARTRVGQFQLATLSAVIYESEDDMKRGWLDVIRAQCHGLATLLGSTNPPALLLWETCMSVPDGIQGILEVFKVLLVDYPGMSCACTMSEGRSPAAVIRDTCLMRELPVQQRVLMKRMARGVEQDPMSMCFLSMDAANYRFEHAFDAMFKRTESVAEHLAYSINYLSEFWDSNNDGCSNLESPYVVSLVPEPVDYFMICATTNTCRARCLDEIMAFEIALTMVDEPPDFVLQQSIQVESRYFSMDDVDNDLHLAPFEVFSLLELADCSRICTGRKHPKDRCLAVTGKTREEEVATAYYCVPADTFQYVSQYNGLPYPADAVVYSLTLLPNDLVDSMYFLTNHLHARTPPVRETVLVLVRNTEEKYSKLVMLQEGGLESTLLQTNVPELAASMAFIEDVFVQPQFEDDVDSSASIYVNGEAAQEANASPTFTPVPLCLRLEVRAWSHEPPVATISTCTAHVGDYFRSEHSQTCLDDGSGNCESVLRLPLNSGPQAVVEILESLGNQTTTTKAADSVAVDVGRVLRMDMTRSIYRTQLHASAINVKHVATSTRQYGRAASGTIEEVCVFVSGTIDLREAWIQNLCLSMTGSDTPSLKETQTVQHSLDLKISCGLNNCVGCQRFPVDPRLQDLQTKCYMASSCTIEKCVGTTVNMRKPLCNLGPIAADYIHQQNIIATTAWMAISHTVITIVELSENRRREYAVLWPEARFNAMMCHWKDLTIHAVAVITSIFVAVDAANEDRKQTSFSASVMDSRFHARRVMTTTAATTFLSSIVLWPIFMAVAAKKTLMCTWNSTYISINEISDFIGGASDTQSIRIAVGDKNKVHMSDAIAGRCLAEIVPENMRNADLPQASGNIATYLGNMITDIFVRVTYIPAEPYLHKFDAAMAYSIGVVQGIQELVQAADWQHCKAPSAATRDIAKCVCGDKPHRIPERIRKQKYAQSAFWCSGPMLLTAASGRDLLIWNPYSLDELLGMHDYDEFLACMDKGEGGCDDVRPVSEFFELQGVEVIQVVTKCRSNYHSRMWDMGVVLMAVLSQEEWQSAPASDLLLKDDGYSVFRRRWAFLWEFISAPKLEDWLHACLLDALDNSLWEHSCMRVFLTSKGYDSVDSYYMYEPSGGGFHYVDACLSFSGEVSQYSDQNSASHPLSIWSTWSDNRLQVAQYHHVLQAQQQDRADVAEAELQSLHAEILQKLSTSRKTMQDIALDIGDISTEGDEIHQIVDCVLLGPYASADLQGAFQTSAGRRWEVPQYHRGDPRSRKFTEGRATGGSETRQLLMAGVLQQLEAQLEDTTKVEAENVFRRMRSVMSDIDNLRCQCAGNDGRSMRCCVFESRDQITFPAQDLLTREWDIADSVLETSMQSSNIKDILNRIWTSKEFVPHKPHVFTEAEKLELRDAYVFNYSQRVLHYSTEDVPQRSYSSPLWHECTTLLSAAFFTIPLRADGSVDVNTEYDPTTVSSDRYLHGMEEVVERIVARARDVSPVFWTHVHRYVPTDSVWCEDTASAPQPHASARSIFETGREWEEGHIDAERVRSPELGAVHFPGQLRCICNWTDAEGDCAVPSCDLLSAGKPTQPAPDWELGEAWAGLCARGSYTSRSDLFLLLEVLHTYSIDTTETCVDLIPSTVWGLLDSRQQRAWYDSQDVSDADVDLQELASNGPAGLRIGLLGRQGSLLQFLKDNDLLRPVRSGVNHWYKHTVAQPFCVNNLQEALLADLSRHFTDVFFPMAHSVHEAPVTAVCSRWVIEYAVSHALALLQTSSEAVSADMVATQNLTASQWQRRCAIQVQQLGICVLRGVFELKPDDWNDGASDCPFALPEGHGCDALFYVTSTCIVMCDGDFFDPCSCNPELASCDDATFSKATCQAGKLPDIRHWADEPTVQLYSMQWPERVLPDEAGGEKETLLELNDELARVREVLASQPLDIERLFNDVREIVAVHDEGVQEGQSPSSFCEDLLDYMPDDAQHPVGYHPTCTCLRETTRMRGFSSWMSTLNGSDTAWSIDPVRMRNMTAYSRVFGGSHLVCDSVAYTAAETELNTYHLTSRWDPAESADAAFPLRQTTHISSLDDMFVLGSNAGQSERDHPLAQGSSSFLHSVGLIRDWFGCYEGHVPGEGGDCRDPAVRDLWQSAWPHWAPDSDEYYGMTSDAEEEVSACSEPPLTTCLSDDECRLVRSDLVCLQPFDPLLSVPGICEKKGRCHQHTHCEWPLMCSGEGECVQPRVYVRNRMPSPLNVQLFAQNRSSCPVDTYGMSQHQRVADFAQSHGLCKFRNWYEYRQMMLDGTEDDLLMRVDLERILKRTNDDQERTMRESSVLKMRPHPCDRSYQHTEFGACTHADLVAWTTSTSGAFKFGKPADAEMEYMMSMRTWEREQVGASALFCNLVAPARTGFLNPYLHRGQDDEEQDTLQFVPQDVRMCREFEVCPVLKFWVDETSVERRMVTIVRYTESAGIQQEQGFRAYRFLDSTKCGAVGALVLDTQTHLCVVDRMVVPAVDFVFMSTVPNTPITQTPPVNPEYSALRPAQDAFGEQVMRGHFSEIRRHCPLAFNPEGAEASPDDAFNRYIQYMTKLTNTYHENSASDVSIHASLLILELFGLFGDTRNAEVRHRGFYALSQYNEKARCAEYILEGLNRVRAYHSSRETVYTVEQLWSPPIPGLSVYVFRGSAPIYMPFAWIWQCVVIATESEGGASRMWFDMLVDHTVSEHPTCTNYLTKKTGSATVKKKLQYSAEIFKLAETVDGDMFAEQILHDINLVLNQGVDALRIPALADIFCLLIKTEEDASCRFDSFNFLFENSGDCWRKNGRSLQNRIIDEQAFKSIQDTINSMGSLQDQRVWVNVIEESRNEILGEKFELYENFLNANLQIFVDEKVIDITEDVNDQVDLAQNFIPRLQFIKAKEWIIANQGSIPKSYDSSNLHIPAGLSNYASLAPENACAGIDGYTAYKLHEQEFKVDRPIEIIPQPLQSIKYLTPHLAKFLLVKYFMQHIYFTPSFILGNLVPDATISARMYSTFDREKWSNMFEEAKSYDDFMLTKKFECKDDLSYKPTIESNRLHRSMRACVQKMQVASGWKVPEGSILHVILSSDILLQGFFPSFVETDDEPGFLQQLFSDKLAPAVDTRNNICFQDRGVPKVMNPYWAGHFDYRTGCDVDPVGDYRQGLRRVDGVCATTSPDETCEERFPEFAATIKKDMPRACLELYAQGTVFTTPPSFSTKPADGDPLCERQPTAEGQCTLSHGTLLQSRGRDLADLHVYEGDIHNAEGVWAEANDVLYGRSEAESENTTAFKVLPTDIIGHTLLFDISESGQLHLACVPLQSEFTGSCRVSAQEMARRSREFWRWQHTVLDKKWPASAGVSSQSWKCPLKWLEAYSINIWTFSAATPSALRNAVRFQHITKPYVYAHPTVHSSSRLIQLFSGRFIDEASSCTSTVDFSPCQGRGRLLSTLRALRDAEQWQQIRHHEDTQCRELLDWPHQDYRFADQTESASMETPRCNVWGRLPRFALKHTIRQAKDVPRNLVPSRRVSPQLWPAPSVSHVCRMGRLRRLQHATSAVPVQYCSPGPQAVVCEAVRVANSTLERVSQEWKVLPDPAPVFVNHRPHRQQHCASCEDHSRYSFVGRDGSSTASTDARHTQLGTGRPIALRPARMVAAFLRKAVCPRAVASCDALHALIGSVDSPDRWTSSSFLRKLLDLPPPPLPVTEEEDASLWDRPWVFCDQTVDGAGCNGSLSKSDWLQSSTRAAQCVAAVQSSKTVRSPPLQFCKLNALTEELCQDLVQWRQAVETIICRAAGLPECPLTGFFYTPTAYSIENGQFVYETVAAFYTGLGATCAQTESNPQWTANAALLAQCASRSLQPVKEMLQQARLIASILFRLYYYFWQVIAQILKLIITVVTNSLKDVGTIANQLVKYLRLFMETIGDIFKEIANAIWIIIFETGNGAKFKKLVFDICDFLNLMHEKLVIETVCPLVKVVHDIADALVKNMLGQIFFGKTYQSVSSFDSVTWCQKNQLKCNIFLLEKNTDAELASPLPLSTRCWSMYSTFFGDSETLSCTPADSCATVTGRTADPVLCGKCPDVPMGLQRYACAPQTKMCTCGVPLITQSACLSNEECQESVSNCRYLNSDFEPAAGSVACSSCMSKSFCFVQGAATGYCACALLDAEFGRCAETDVGQTVMPTISGMCLLTRSDAARTSMVYSIYFEDALATPCQSLFSETTVCVNVPGQGYYQLGYGRYSARGRRLLHEKDPAGGSEFTTKSPLCTDALRSNLMPAVRSACQQAYAASLSTLRELNLSSSLAPCALCSMEDFQDALQTHPREIMRVALHPAHATMVLLRHSPLRHGVQTMKRLRESAYVLSIDLAQMAQLYYDDANTSSVPPLLRRFLQTWGSWHLENHTHRKWTQRAHHRAPAGLANESQSNQSQSNQSQSNQSQSNQSQSNTAVQRRLLNVGILSTIDTAFTGMMQTHESYKNRINTGWNYDYPDLVATTDGRMPWVDAVWPPLLPGGDPASPSAEEATCNTLGGVVDILSTGIRITESSYTSAPPGPNSSLQEQWITLLDAKYASPNITLNEEDDWVVRNTVWASKHLLKLFGVGPDQIYNVVYSIVQEFRRFVVCDFESVQTCSRWKMRIVPGMIVVGVLMACVVYALFAVGMPLMGIFCTVLYVPLVFYFCYGHSPTCIFTGLVPACLMQDVVQTLQSVLPSFILLPHSMLRPGCSMNEDSLFLKEACIVPCTEQPFEFRDWHSVLAWGVAELGEGAVSWTDSTIDRVPLIDVEPFREHLWTKHGVYRFGGASLVAGHRICAAVSSYKVFPYLFFLLVFVVFAFVILALLLDLIFAVLVLLSSLSITFLFE